MAMKIKGIPMPSRESPQRAVNDKRDNSRVQPSGRGKAGYGGYSEGGENPRAGSGMKAGQDGGVYSQPQLVGAAKAKQRASESRYTSSNAQRDSAAKNYQAAYNETDQDGRDPSGRGNKALGRSYNKGSTPKAGGEGAVTGTRNGLPAMRYEPTPAAGNIPPRGNQGDMRSGMDKALSDHADKLHPVKKGSLGAKGKASPRMSSY
jgi:hypothetical protein